MPKVEPSAVGFKIYGTENPEKVIAAGVGRTSAHAEEMIEDTCSLINLLNMDGDVLQVERFEILDASSFGVVWAR